MLRGESKLPARTMSTQYNSYLFVLTNYKPANVYIIP